MLGIKLKTPDYTDILQAFGPSPCPLPVFLVMFQVPWGQFFGEGCFQSLLTLESSIPSVLAGTVRPICLPFFDEELMPGTPLWVIGWGFTKQDGGKAWA